MVQEIRPNSPPQEASLASSADIEVYGGSAGGGKTFALLLEALRHANNREFTAVIFRRTSPEITNPGGLWDEAAKLYPQLGGEGKVGNLEYVFPPGSRVCFRHLQHEKDKHSWQGAQIALICFDELTHFTESQFFYLLSRNRSTCGVDPYVRATTNPDASSWVKRFLAPWVDRKFADPAASGEIRWFVRVDGKIRWGRTREQLIEEFGPDALPKSVTFVRASIFDNVDLLRINPGYLANLKALPPVEQARLLYGDWDIVNEGLVYADFGTCVVELEEWPATLGAWHIGGIDWGIANPFAGLCAFLDFDDVLWVGWERYLAGSTLTEHSKALPREVRYWADPAGADQIAEVRSAGHDIVPCVHLGQRSLESGIGLVQERIRNGRLKVLGTLGNLIEEAGKYRYPDDKPGEKPLDKFNHALSALRYMIVGIDRMRSVKDAPPAPTREQIQAAEDEAKRIREEAESNWKRVDNPAFW
jgi:Terminase large subunit, T4likevirus-type, N-terminal